MKVMLCLPGTAYSREFLLAWTDMVMQLARTHEISVSQHLTRSLCVGNSPVFNGQDYDAALFIDPNILFTIDDVRNLLESPRDVTAGIYMTPSLQTFDVIRVFNEDFMKKDGHYKFLKPQDIEGASQYMKVDYTGLGFLLLKKGVIESYNGSILDMNDPMTFCKNLPDIYVDTKIRVGNQQLMIL